MGRLVAGLSAAYCGACCSLLRVGGGWPTGPDAVPVRTAGLLRLVEACCGLLRLVAACWGLLRFVETYCGLLRFVEAYCGPRSVQKPCAPRWPCCRGRGGGAGAQFAACCDLLLLIAAYCGLLWLVAVYCGLLWLVAACCGSLPASPSLASLSPIRVGTCRRFGLLRLVAVLLRLVAACCGLLRLVAPDQRRDVRQRDLAQGWGGPFGLLMETAAR